MVLPHVYTWFQMSRFKQELNGVDFLFKGMVVSQLPDMLSRATAV